MDVARTGERAIPSATRLPGRAAPDTRAPLLLPFPGLRYDPAVAGPLGQLLAPPHTELGKVARAAALARSPYVVTHLERPEYTAHETPGRTVEQWMDRGALRADAPGYYVVQQRQAGRAHRFLLAALTVGPQTDDRVHAHEGTMDDAVVSRMARLDATGVDSEPVLLVDGGDTTGTSPGLFSADAELTGDHVAHTVARDCDDTTVDVWHLRNPSLLQRMQSSLTDRQLLIADGHHRYAAVRRKAQQTGRNSLILVAISDARTDPVRVSALHRVFPASAAAHLLTTVVNRARPVGWEAVSAEVAELEEPFTLVLAHGELVRVRTGRVGEGVRGAGGWVDATIHAAGVDDREVIYEPHAATAWAAGPDRSVAFLPTPRLDEVLRIARSGTVLARKTTSFAPKPLAGAVLRLR